jgi:hypothetical protein
MWRQIPVTVRAPVITSARGWCITGQGAGLAGAGRWVQITFTFQHGQSREANLSAAIAAEKVRWREGGRNTSPSWHRLHAAKVVVREYLAWIWIWYGRYRVAEREKWIKEERARIMEKKDEKSKSRVFWSSGMRIGVSGFRRLDKTWRLLLQRLKVPKKTTRSFETSAASLWELQKSHAK